MSDESFVGCVIITWPKHGGHVALPGWSVMFTDADSGQPITSVLALKLDATPQQVITAEMTMLVDTDGSPLLNSRSAAARTDDGEHLLTGVFHWLVAEMRIAD